MIGPKDIRRVADLARVEIPDNEIEKYSDQLKTIVDYMGILGKLDTQDVSAMMHASSSDDVFREDEEKPCMDRAQALSNAGSHDGVHIKVPKTV